MEKRTILIVDDDNYIRSLYSEVFKNYGFEVLEAVDGKAGLDLVLSKKPDVVFTGIMMPNMTGFELLKTLKENPETKNIPVLINSHLGKDEDRRKAAELGAADFLVKGLITPKEIVETVSMIFDRKVYRVELDMAKLDAQKLAGDLGLGDFFIEIVPDPKGNKKISANIIERK